MTAREQLKQIRKLDTLIKNKMVEREQWRSMALNVTPKTSGDRVQSSGNQQKMADAINHYVDLEREIDQAIDELYDKRQAIISAIEELPVLEYDVLHKRYVQGMTLDEIAEKRGFSYSYTAGLQTRALKLLDCIWEYKEKQKEV